MALTAHQPAGSSTSRSRAVLVGVLAALLVVGGLIDRRAAPASPGRPPATRAAAAPADALSSTWFCAGATGPGGTGGVPATTADGSAPPAPQAAPAAGTLIVAATSDRPLHGRVELVGSTGASVTLPLDVPAEGRVSVPETPLLAAPFVAASVVLAGGGAAVEQQVAGPDGLSASVCAPAGAEHWYFASGTTVAGASLMVSLYNPYADEAIADLSFSTEQGQEAPADFQGILVPPRSVIGVDVGTHLRRRERIATTVAARAGRVLAFKTQVEAVPPGQGPTGPNPPPAGAAAGPPPVGAAAGPPPVGAAAGPPLTTGLTIVLGATGATSTWMWADGIKSEGVDERYVVYNPGSADAEVALSVALDQGAAEPIRVTVPAHDTATIDSSTQSRLPAGSPHAAVLRAPGAGVVAERVVTLRAPSHRTGLLELFGAPSGSTRWLLAAGGAAPGVDEIVSAYNPGTTSAHLSVVQLAGGSVQAPEGLQGLTLAPGRRLAVRVNDFVPRSDDALLVEADAPIVVQRDVYLGAGPAILATLPVALA